MTSLSSFKTLGVLLFPEFETLDVFGPLEMFGMLSDRLEIAMISEQGGLVKSAQGQFIHTEFHWNNAPHLDLLLIPGGMGTRKEVFNSPKHVQNKASSPYLCVLLQLYWQKQVY